MTAEEMLYQEVQELRDTLKARDETIKQLYAQLSRACIALRVKGENDLANDIFNKAYKK